MLLCMMNEVLDAHLHAEESRGNANDGAESGDMF